MRRIRISVVRFQRIFKESQKISIRSHFAHQKQEILQIILIFGLTNQKTGAILMKHRGEMVEWTKAPHWKCGVGQLTEGSNPSLSAIFFCQKMAERRRKSSLHAFVSTKALHSKPKVFFTSSPSPREDLLVKSLLSVACEDVPLTFHL